MMKPVAFLFAMLLGIITGVLAFQPPKLVVVRLNAVPQIVFTNGTDTGSSYTPVTINIPTTPTAEKSTKKIVVYLSKQRFIAYGTDGKIFLSGPVSSAKGGMIMDLNNHPDTPHNHVGTFEVLRRERNHYSKEWHCQMPYSMFYHSGHAIHACQKSDIKYLGTPASHGCIRVHPDNARKLYKWAQIGTIISIN